MAETATPTLSEQYLLKKEEKMGTVTTPTEEPEVKTPPISESVEVETPKTEESLVVSDEAESSTATATEESTETTPNEGESATEEANVSAEKEESGDQEVEEADEIKIETAPADFRFPTTNQTRHCFTRYVEYHRCVAAKGDGASECDRFAKYYRALCPGEWVDRWNEQRENGTFPGPL